ncbi:MAG: hypothetical protein A3H98_01620 [Bacteroidetes bacterium RIFCSPLOWO2_02_FULL_36_8]|nr:MAG: hypothetical protein A3H98_01620 [Bacteroidetes bacterium RIFCSPLOWO2_02_FULL_36_8]OFY69357.1 MAG: hypothetical protein A3G23_00965 [Bacteroidetes bacterium RIFCSPLOWO2_12_FULL_37_12]
MNHTQKTRAITILLVEDNPGDIRLTVEAFKEGKIKNKMIVIQDGEEAIQFLKKKGMHKKAITPDLILLDLNLPKIDGREVLTEIKNDPLLKIIPVIVLTTSDSEKDVFHTYINHANCYITKPVDFTQFMNVIKTIEQFWFSIVKLPHLDK